MTSPINNDTSNITPINKEQVQNYVNNSMQQIEAKIEGQDSTTTTLNNPLKATPNANTLAVTDPNSDNNSTPLISPMDLLNNNQANSAASSFRNLTQQGKKV